MSLKKTGVLGESPITSLKRQKLNTPINSTVQNYFDINSKQVSTLFQVVTENPLQDVMSNPNRDE